MGLTIRAKTTGESIDYSYTVLHNRLRWLVLVYCGMPDKLDKSIFDFYSMHHAGDINSFHLFLMPYDDLSNFLFSLQLAGYLFPNCMLHSDCDGNYTKKGKVCKDQRLLTGNSIGLLKELKILLDDDDLKKMSVDNVRIKTAIDYVKKLHDILKNEIDNGIGAIIF